ncbi:uncharacterized protein ARMOST_21344 [Armillaria ostoyae]|uniref:Uncharacterized protein n=1 Tax=Armillaria ostoyae TaxID=47428 RepID=A0A284S9V2_ARMOS|nr:uncharacterized protein ARMOST_21344 [Armillaria ostoyae]
MYINGQEIDLDEEEDEQPQTTPAEETIHPELVTCSFCSRRSRSISEAPLKQKPSPPIPIVAPIPTPQKAPSPSSSPISLSPIKIHSSSPVQSRSSVRSSSATNVFAPIKVVRATRDNMNPSNLVSLSSSWQNGWHSVYIFLQATLHLTWVGPNQWVSDDCTCYKYLMLTAPEAQGVFSDWGRKKKH